MFRAFVLFPHAPFLSLSSFIFTFMLRTKDKVMDVRTLPYLKKTTWRRMMRLDARKEKKRKEKDER